MSFMDEVVAVVLGCNIYLDRVIDQGTLEAERRGNVWAVYGVEDSVFLSCVHARPVQ